MQHGALIGEGTYGRVFALCTKDGKPALFNGKEVVRKEFKGSFEAVAEISCLQGLLGCRHVVTFISGNTYGCLRYRDSVDMERMTVGDLSSFILPSVRIANSDVVHLCLQLLEGLTELQKRSFCHRDIKPGNIGVCMEKGSMVLKYIDFGLGKWVNVEGPQHKLRAHTLEVVTQWYKCPELLSHSVVEGRIVYDPFMADLWSVMVVMFLLVTGFFPFSDLRQESDRFCHVKSDYCLLLNMSHKMGENVPTDTDLDFRTPAWRRKEISPLLPPWFVRVASRFFRFRPSERMTLPDALEAVRSSASGSLSLKVRHIPAVQPCWTSPEEEEGGEEGSVGTAATPTLQAEEAEAPATPEKAEKGGVLQSLACVCCPTCWSELLLLPTKEVLQCDVCERRISASSCPSRKRKREEQTAGVREAEAHYQCLDCDYDVCLECAFSDLHAPSGTSASNPESTSLCNGEQ